ncbi:MAG: hypothetical protein JSV62_13190 [Promethearchaeota archaeon]|nr:MAG: hypothetical protein JSV62_13190 [Candidatus Lokiarchaeota archaeon]
MVDFSGEDWLIGLSTFGIIIFGYILGSYFFYKSRKLNIRLLTFYSLSQILSATAWLPIVIEFFSVLLASISINKVLYVYLMWLPAPIAGILMYYITTEFIAPKKKWYVLTPYLAFVGFIMIGTILNPLGSVIFIEPPLTGFIHKAGLNPQSFASFLNIIGFLFLICFMESGYIYKAIKSEDIIRKKFIYLSISIFLILGFGLLDSFTTSVVLVLVRLGAMSSFLFVYLGLREVPEKTIKEKPKKEIKVEDSLFRIAKRPDQITEEEVTYYREQKICLVCKGKVGGFNAYICTGCDALYCENCARALSDLENSCWVCNEPIDKSKPSKPFTLKKELEDLGKIK